MRGNVIAIGVLNIIFALGFLLCGTAVSLGGAALLGGGKEVGKQLEAGVAKAREDAAAKGASAEEQKQIEEVGGLLAKFGPMLGAYGAAAFAFCGISQLVYGVLYLVAAIGCFKFAGFGRVLTLVLSFLGLIPFVLGLMGGWPLLIFGVHIYFLVIMFNAKTAELFRNRGVDPGAAAA